MMRSSFLLSFLLAASLEVLAQPKIAAVVNAASFQSGLPYGGALATAYASGLSGLTPGIYMAPFSKPLPLTLAGLQVTVNGAVAPILAVVVPSDPSADIQVNFQVPLERNVSLTSTLSGSSLTIAGGGRVAILSPLPAPPAWSAFALSLSGAFFSDANRVASALHASDSSLVTPLNPAHPGESIVVYADDFFSTWPPPPIGVAVDRPSFFQPAQRPGFAPGVGSPNYHLYLQTYPVPAPCPPSANQGALCSASVTNTPALQISFEGLAAGIVGVEEIDFVVPVNQQPGNWPLFFNDGSCPDGSGVPGTCASIGGVSSPYVLLTVD